MRIVVREWERVLVYRDGRYVEVLGPGRHWRGRWRRELVPVALRPRLVPVTGQEMLTGDGLAVKVSLLVRSSVADPRLWHESVENPDGFVYGAVQVALREAVSRRTLDELLAARIELGEEIVRSASAAAAEVGIALGPVAVRDLMVPSELRRAATEAATARAEGLAALERARGEVAATRALANAARMVADNPALLSLRTLQAVEAGRATVVFTTDGTSYAAAQAAGSAR